MTIQLPIPGSQALSIPDVGVIGAAIAVILVLVAAYIVLSQLAGTRRP